MTTNNPIRKNPLPLPTTLARRNKSDVDLGAIARSVSVQTTLLAKIARPGPREPKIVSTAHGPLKHILFCYPAYATGEFSYKQVYEDLFRKLPKTTQFTILTHPSVTNDLLAALDSTDAEEIYTGTGEKQPIFHIDMFISLAGRSPSGKYRLLVGSPTYADQILLGQEPVDHALGEIFDDIANTLQDVGFEVIRNPMPLTYVDIPEIKVRTWYFATANNCLIEIDPNSGNSVWLPTYGHGDWADLAPIDAENKRIWEELGFKVYELTDFHPFAQNLGSVHCIKKYLER
ncbi:hypothetical protein WA1_39680 [Scytonema hofmannii PCC 7110]|uniref:Uncharacterized protein n=1 Tax=Scytonema hofmannii PCC 7110 TaxID=128403 RepID=A0A139WYZ1_9CYAN|nr:hypothetical protein [Scytonema hofmannii]KYC37592.1 hypothetical protein WA1_39680 [Scytonema hofmannii PCC 7110]